MNDFTVPTKNIRSQPATGWWMKAQKQRNAVRHQLSCEAVVLFEQQHSNIMENIFCFKNKNLTVTTLRESLFYFLAKVMVRNTQTQRQDRPERESERGKVMGVNWKNWPNGPRKFRQHSPASTYSISPNSFSFSKLCDTQGENTSQWLRTTLEITQSADIRPVILSHLTIISFIFQHKHALPSWSRNSEAG